MSEMTHWRMTMDSCAHAVFDPFIAGLIIGAGVVWFMQWLIDKAGE